SQPAGGGGGAGSSNARTIRFLMRPIARSTRSTALALSVPGLGRTAALSGTEGKVRTRMMTEAFLSMSPPGPLAGTSFGGAGPSTRRSVTRAPNPYARRYAQGDGQIYPWLSNPLTQK